MCPTEPSWWDSPLPQTGGGAWRGCGWGGGQTLEERPSRACSAWQGTGPAARGTRAPREPRVPFLGERQCQEPAWLQPVTREGEGGWKGGFSCPDMAPGSVCGTAGESPSGTGLGPDKGAPNALPLHQPPGPEVPGKATAPSVSPGQPREGRPPAALTCHGCCFSSALQLGRLWRIPSASYRHWPE